MIILIVAVDMNFLIGSNNKLPWHYSEDLLFFKKKTLNKDVLMGTKTYYSLKTYYKNKSFPFKKVYVADLFNTVKDDNVLVIKDLIFFLKECLKKKRELFIIGGSQIYSQSLSYVQKIYITYILKRYRGDSYFPHFDYNQYFIKEKKILKELIFVTWQKKIKK